MSCSERNLINLCAFLVGFGFAVLAGSAWASTYVAEPDGVAPNKSWYDTKTGSACAGFGLNCSYSEAIAALTAVSNTGQTVDHQYLYFVSMSGTGCNVAGGACTVTLRYSWTHYGNPGSEGNKYLYGTGSLGRPNVSPCEAKSGQTVSAGLYDLGTDDNALPATSACDGSCESGYNGSGVVARQMVGGEYHYFSQGAYVYTGAECTEGNPVPNALSSMPPPSCDPVTQDSGEVNGKTVCLDKYIPPDTVEETPVVENPDGSTTKTTTTTDGKTGDKKTSTTTTQPDGTKTTTTTITPAPSGPAGDFCKLHPADPSCRDPKDGRWDGKGTGKGFGEEGDVVEAKAAVGLKIAEIRDSIAAKFGSAGAMSGEIPCDSVQVLGQSFSVCLATYQSTFDMIGSALLAVALIIAFLMVLM